VWYNYATRIFVLFISFNQDFQLIFHEIIKKKVNVFVQKCTKNAKIAKKAQKQKMRQKIRGGGGKNNFTTCRKKSKNSTVLSDRKLYKGFGICV